MGLSPPKFIFILTNDYVKRFLIACSFEFIFYYLKASLPPNTVSNNRVMEEPEVIVEMVIFWLTLVTRQKTQRIHPFSLYNNNNSQQHRNFSNSRQEEALQASDMLCLWTRGTKKKIPNMQVAWQKLDAEHQ